MKTGSQVVEPNVKTEKLKIAKKVNKEKDAVDTQNKI